MLDRENCDGGVSHYDPRGEGDLSYLDEEEWWGKPPAVYTMERVAREWNSEGNPSIQIGNMSKDDGGYFYPHSTHDRGRSVDIRPMMNLATRRRLAANDETLNAHFNDDHNETLYNRYDQDRSVEFLKLLFSLAPKDQGRALSTAVLCNDPDISDCPEPGEDGYDECISAKGGDWEETDEYREINNHASEHGIDYHPILWVPGHHHHYHVIIATTGPLEL